MVTHARQMTPTSPTMESAILELTSLRVGVKHIVVCGHSDCKVCVDEAGKHCTVDVSHLPATPQSHTDTHTRGRTYEVCPVIFLLFAMEGRTVGTGRNKVNYCFA